MGVPSRLTEMQRKFAELLILHEGRKFDYECAIEAGYSENRSRPMKPHESTKSRTFSTSSKIYW